LDSRLRSISDHEHSSMTRCRPSRQARKNRLEGSRALSVEARHWPESRPSNRLESRSTKTVRPDTGVQAAAAIETFFIETDVAMIPKSSSRESAIDVDSTNDH
jgi:hypothetical protein